MAGGEHSVLDALKRRAANAGSREELRQLASEVGHAMAEGHLDAQSAHELSRAVARARRRRDAHDEAYLSAISDILAAVSGSKAHAEERAVGERAIEASPALQQVVRALHERPLGPTAIAQAMGHQQNDGRVTRHLKTLEELGLVEPARSANLRERLRQLTPRGHRIAAALSAQPGLKRESAEAPGAIVESVVAMLHLAVRGRDVSMAELAASAVHLDTASEALARAFTALGERRGLLDVTVDQRCIWERRETRWRAVLESYATRREALRAAFAPVPKGFVLCAETDDVDDWRGALRIAEVDGVADVGTHLFAASSFRPGELSAIVSTDETVGRDVAASLQAELYFATKHRDELVIQPLVS